MRSDRGERLPVWPEWCYLPLAGANAVVSGGGDRLGADDLAKVLDVSALAALAAWRMTKGLYRFDPDILGTLWDTPLTGDLPTDLLLRLAEWCVYVQTQGRAVMDKTLHGFYAHLEADPQGGRRELRLLLDYDAGLSPLPIHLVGSLAEGLEQTTREAELQAAQAGLDIGALRAQFDHHPGGRWAAEAAPLVSLLLYLCSDRPDLVGPGTPGNPQPRKIKGGPKLFAAPGVKTWDVAYRLGAAFRQAHFHTFLSGLRSGPRTRTLRWLPPVAVGFDPDGYAELPAVVRPVRGGRG